MKIDEIAKLLSNRINQEHYTKHYLVKVANTMYKQGLKDGKMLTKDILMNFAEDHFKNTKDVSSKDINNYVDKYLNK